MRYVELFAGGGGLSHGLDNAGWHCLAHAEIEPHARAVLRKRWPGVPLLGDVSAIDGTQWRGLVDVISGGSPCQDMSVAGKRGGLDGSRSILFYEQVRIWNESGAPYLIWENVPGAFSSNNGKDFATVLSALVGAAVTVPRDGWERAGVAAGATGVAAWRVLDLQHFGPPQRRARVFIVATRTGGVDPAEVLALSESVCGHPSPREQSREDVTGTLSARTHGGGGLGTDFECEGGVVATMVDGGRSHGAGIEFSTEVPTLRTPGGGSSHPYVANTITAREAKGWNPARDVGNGTVSHGRPRRLTPVECELLMSWPRGWTQYGIREDGTEYELSDTARYRICGNGVGSVCAQWIAEHFHRAPSAQGR